MIISNYYNIIVGILLLFNIILYPTHNSVTRRWYRQIFFCIDLIRYGSVHSILSKTKCNTNNMNIAPDANSIIFF